MDAATPLRPRDLALLLLAAQQGPPRQRARNQIGHGVERRLLRLLRHSLGDCEPECITPEHLQDRYSQTGMTQIKVQFGQLVASNPFGEISRLPEDKK